MGVTGGRNRMVGQPVASGGRRPSVIRTLLVSGLALMAIAALTVSLLVGVSMADSSCISGRADTDAELRACIGVPQSFSSGRAPPSSELDFHCYIDATIYDRCIELPLRRLLGERCFVMSKSERDDLVRQSLVVWGAGPREGQ